MKRTSERYESITSGVDSARPETVGAWNTEEGIAAQRERVASLREKLGNSSDPAVVDLDMLADKLIWKAVWIIGGDGWAYDIGYGGLDLSLIPI